MLFVSSYTMQRFLDGVADSYDHRTVEREIQREANNDRRKKEATENKIRKIYDFLCDHPGIAYTCTDLLVELPEFRNTQQVSSVTRHITFRIRAKEPIVEGATVPIHRHLYKNHLCFCAGDFKDFADGNLAAEYRRSQPQPRDTY